MMTKELIIRNHAVESTGAKLHTLHKEITHWSLWKQNFEYYRGAF